MTSEQQKAAELTEKQRAQMRAKTSASIAAANLLSVIRANKQANDNKSE